MDTTESHKTRTRNDYTVGWVCALPKEQAAAMAMLDDRHEDLPKPSNDENSYTLGAVGRHNVVIACLPKGKTGTISAAAVAVRMVSTFPSIKLGVLVGIGSGIPSKGRVRLGDVVVGTPVGEFPGVVQWDFGKSTTTTSSGSRVAGGFVRTGALNNPPTSLLTALAKLEAEQELHGMKVPEYLDELKKRFPRLAARYLRSESQVDILFKADYSHVNAVTGNSEDEEDDEDDDEESCKFCDRSKLVKRKARTEMRVHYGLIASGNRAIQDAVFRDALNKDFGGNIWPISSTAA
ncbi:hypothetical protein ABW20_dc0103370 [Dactylellina cionopaga]|nr:hypothetical protein ABW20_dc0103370 [Dactylellina cionopaga]